MHDNKVRLSQDVLEKAELIAAEWGLKNARAAVEAVFRRYSDEYLNGRRSLGDAPAHFPVAADMMARKVKQEQNNSRPNCEALDALEDLLAM
ncbi:MAG TPA: hypothetical protein V6C78_03600 [Crinalium sp.]|jgi:hypothetical protein